MQNPNRILDHSINVAVTNSAVLSSDQVIDLTKISDAQPLAINSEVHYQSSGPLEGRKISLGRGGLNSFTLSAAGIINSEISRFSVALMAIASGAWSFGKAATFAFNIFPVNSRQEIEKIDRRKKEGKKDELKKEYINKQHIKQLYKKKKLIKKYLAKTELIKKENAKKRAIDAMTGVFPDFHIV